jgi:hypothetical protein
MVVIKEEEVCKKQQTKKSLPTKSLSKLFISREIFA